MNTFKGHHAHLCASMRGVHAGSSSSQRTLWSFPPHPQIKQVSHQLGERCEDVLPDDLNVQNPSSAQEVAVTM